MHPSVVRRWIVIRLAVGLLLGLGSATGIGPSRRGGETPIAVVIATYGLCAFLLVCVLLVRRTYRQPSAAAWHALGRWHTAFGAVMLCAYPAALLLGARAPVVRASMGFTWYAVLLLFSASRIRDAIRERIWEQDQEDVAPVFD